MEYLPSTLHRRLRILRRIDRPSLFRVSSHNRCLPMKRLAFALVSLIAIAALAPAQEKPAKKSKTKEKPDVNAMAFAGQYQWGDWVEKDFPFFSSALDARDAGEVFPKDNLTPRGIILNLGHDLWACFDTDLLRISAIWQGKGVTPVALATGSYRIAGQKTKDGQDDLPKPDGTVWLANGIYAGWQVGKTEFSLKVQVNARPEEFPDPREPAPSPEEVGRGPLDEKLGRFRSLHVAGKTVVLEYEVAGTVIRDRFWSDASAPQVLHREMSIDPHMQKLDMGFGYHVGPDDKINETPPSNTQATLVSEWREHFLSASFAPSTATQTYRYHWNFKSGKTDQIGRAHV